MQRLLVIYNPYSSQCTRIEHDVLRHLHRLKGYTVGKVAIKLEPFAKNLQHIKSLLKDGDIVLAVGGDATAAVAANAILESQKNATLGVLPYGNFNDLARTLGTMHPRDLLQATDDSDRLTFASSTRELYPLDISVNQKHFRYAACYVSIGMTAEAVEIFDDPKIRRNLRKGHHSSWRSYLHLARWYFKNRHSKVFLPPFTINGHPATHGVSDYFAVNGRSVCRVMRGTSACFESSGFHRYTGRLTRFPVLFRFMATAILHHIPGSSASSDRLAFSRPASVELQAEGDYQVFDSVTSITIAKSPRPIRVICKK